MTYRVRIYRRLTGENIVAGTDLTYDEAKDLAKSLKWLVCTDVFVEELDASASL